LRKGGISSENEDDCQNDDYHAGGRSRCCRRCNLQASDKISSVAEVNYILWKGDEKMNPTIVVVAIIAVVVVVAVGIFIAKKNRNK